MTKTNEPQSSELMDKSLRFAVPMWIAELADRDIKTLQARAEICSKAVSSKGDILMYGSKRKGEAGEVFNRLAEGMACLVLITKHPVPFGKTVFYHDRDPEVFDSEKKANERVWPKKMSDLREKHHGTSESQAVPAVRKKARKKSDRKTDAGTGS